MKERGKDEKFAFKDADGKVTFTDGSAENCIIKVDGNIYLRTIFDTASNKSDFTKDDVFGLVSAETSKF